MADNYKVKVNVEIVKCTDAVIDKCIQAGVGIFERIISVEQAQSIDVCEQILLQTNYAALRDAFASHCNTMSRQHALETVEELEACEVKPYRVEGEIGRITFDTYWVEPGAGSDETAKCLFPTLHGKEWYRTTGFKEIGLVHGTVEDSYRKTSTLINRVRHQEDATPFYLFDLAGFIISADLCLALADFIFQNSLLPLIFKSGSTSNPYPVHLHSSG